MSRPLRLEFPGAWWHVTNRGVEQRDIFLDDRDRRTFLRMLAEAVPRFRWCVHAFVLMTNNSVLNPVRAKMVSEAGGWPWSSYRATAGLARIPAWLTTAAILDRFDPSDSNTAKTLYRGFVNPVGEVKSP